MHLILTLLVALVFAGAAWGADISQSSWSETDGSNNSAPPAGWPAGMAPNQVEPSARAMMGATKRFYDHINAVAQSAGSPNAQTINYAVAPAGYVPGDRYMFYATLTNTGPMSININGLGAVAVHDALGNALGGSEVQIGRFYEIFHDGAFFRILGNTNIFAGDVFIRGGGLFLDNNKFVSFKNSSNQYWDALQLDAGNNLLVGSTNFSGEIGFYNGGTKHAAIDNVGNIYALSGSILMENNKFYGVKNSSGVYGPGLWLDNTNALQIGSTTFAGEIGFYNGGAKHAAIDTSGNIFALTGSIFMENNKFISIKNSSNQSWNALQLDTGNNLVIGSTNFAGEIGFYNGGAKHAAIDNVGNIYALSGSILMENNKFYGVKNSSGTYGPGLWLDNTNTLQIGSTTFAGPIQFYNNGAQRAYIDASGNMAIGGQYFVGVGGSVHQINCSNILSAASSCSVDATNAGNISAGTLPSGRLSGAYGIGNLIVSNSLGGGGGNIGLDNGANLLFKDSGGTYHQALAVNGSNDVIIGSTLFTSGGVKFFGNSHQLGQFDFAGNFQTTGTIETLSNQIYFSGGVVGSGLPGPAGTGLFNTFSGGAYFLARNDGVATVRGGLGDCTYNGGSGWSCSSDENKKNSSPLRGTLAAIKELNPISYTLKDDPKHLPHLGFGAQAVEKVFPQIVAYAPDGSKSLEYTGLIAPLVAAVQELSARVDSLEAQLRDKRAP